jgi:hypothetical protein
MYSVLNCHSVAKYTQVLLGYLWLTNPYKKESRERGGHAIGATLPIHRPGERVLYSRTSLR